MVISASYEMKTFAASILLAILCWVTYDLAAAFSAATGKKAIWDIIGWSLASILCGAGWFYALEGQLRWYMLFAAVCGSVIYFFTARKYVFKTFSLIALLICRFFHIIFKIVLTPTEFLGKILNVYIKKAKTKFFRKVEDENYAKKA